MAVKLHTNHGTITIELDTDKAPESAQNFIAYVEAGHYDNTLFHRVIDGFMIQGGGFEPGMKQKQTKAPVKNEADNGLKNERGTVAMARTQDPHSATAQFFINVADNTFLDFKSESSQGCRITSYNVCYTKLLRLAGAVDGKTWVADGRETGADVYHLAVA